MRWMILNDSMVPLPQGCVMSAILGCRPLEPQLVDGFDGGPGEGRPEAERLQLGLAGLGRGGVVAAFFRNVLDRSAGGKTGIFFFSSRRRHTRFDCDWSSDVCSSD